MKIIHISIMFSLGLIGCSSNYARLDHFPSTSQMDFEKIDSLQNKNSKPHRFFYNCNFENDYLIKISGLSLEDIRNKVQNAIQTNNFSVSKGSDSLVIAERGTSPWEWNTIAVAYIKNVDTVTYLYLRTEISQDFTCGPNINRAKPIVSAICGQGNNCTEIKEIEDKTKEKTWPNHDMDGGLERELSPKKGTGNLGATAA
jgi:hypothetical protein